MEIKVIEKARNIKLLILDADGVLTDGKILYDDTGKELKRFDVRDGHGIKLLMRAGLDVGIITGRESKALGFRAGELGISIVYQKIYNKLEAYEEIILERGLDDKEIAYVGDDLVDVPLMKRVGLSVAVADGSEYAREAADYITLNNGGDGAVREVCELILKAQDKWAQVTERYFLRNQNSRG